ncbi:hypothetical protein ACW9KT_21745 [Hymenobacter sp. HD11105]
MPIIARTDYTIAWKIFMYSTFTIISITSAWSIVNALAEKDFFYIYVYAIPAFVGCVAGFIYVLRHKLELTETTILQYGFRTKSILLENIEEFSESLGSYLIKSGQVTIRITNDLQSKDLFKEQLIAQFKQVDAEKNCLPGTALSCEDSHNLILQIQHRVNMGVEADTIMEADASIIEELSEPFYYLVYEHPNHNFLNRAYDTGNAQLKAFLKQYGEHTGAPNMDVWVLPHSLDWLVLCSHEGEFFYHSGQ